MKPTRQTKSLRQRTRKEIQARDMWRVLHALVLELCADDETAADEVFDSLYEFHEFLEAESRKFNLTAIRDLREAVIKHYVDSLLPLKLFDFLPNEKSAVIDLGSGAGFPGLPLAIMRPRIYFTLLDATKKRCNFLTQAAEGLGLRNTVVLWSRSEDAGRNPQHRERYDAAIARALAPLPELLELAAPLLRLGGRLYAYKGPNVEQEIEESTYALEVLECDVAGLHQYTLPEINEPRSMLIIEKTGPTPPKYPRPAGTPQKKPLTPR